MQSEKRVAVLTCPLGKRFVHRFLEKHGVLGDVGGVAVPAIHHVRTDIDVRPAESSLFIIVTFPAQRLNRFDDQGKLF